MNNSTTLISACAVALAFGAANTAHATDTPGGVPYGVDREALHSGLAAYELPPASELARDITRDIVGAQPDESPFMADFRASGSQFPPSDATPAPGVRAVGAGQSDHDAGEKDSSGPLAWLRAGLGKLAELLSARK